MELKKTTILSAFVVAAGVLAEIIFRDTLSKSYVGVALGIVLAVVVLAAFYFTVDGVYCLGSLRWEEESRKQKEYEQRVYTVLNEQLKFQKAVYSEVKNLQQQLSEQQREPEEALEQAADIQRQEPANITRDDLIQLASEINDHTMRLVSEMKECTIQAASEINEYTARIGADIDGHTAQAVSDINSHTTLTADDVRSYTAQAMSEMNSQLSSALPDRQEQAVLTDTEAREMAAQAVSEINEHTMQAAKVVAKYIAKNTEELKKEIHKS